MRDLLEQGDAINQMMQVTGEERMTLEDFVSWQKSMLLDISFLQQGAFDEVDCCMPRERQLESFRLVTSLIDREYHFKDREEVLEFFTSLIGMYKNWNYSSLGSDEYAKYKSDIEAAADPQVAN